MSKLNPDDFSIVKDNKRDFKNAVIERSNLTNQFTVAEVEIDYMRLEQTEKELTAQIKLSTAALDNIGRNHPFVMKLSDEQLATAAYVYETKKVKSQAESKLKQVKNGMKKYRNVLETIYKKFGFVQSNVLDHLNKQDEPVK